MLGSIQEDLRRAKSQLAKLATVEHPRFDQKPWPNMHKTNSFPNENETSFMKSVRERGKGDTDQTRKSRRRNHTSSPEHVLCDAGYSGGQDRPNGPAEIPPVTLLEDAGPA